MYSETEKKRAEVNSEGNTKKHRKKNYTSISQRIFIRKKAGKSMAIIVFGREILSGKIRFCLSPWKLQGKLRCCFLFLYCGYQILETKHDTFAACLATENKMTIRLGLRLILVFLKPTEVNHCSYPCCLSFTVKTLCYVQIATLKHVLTVLSLTPTDLFM